MKNLRKRKEFYFWKEEDEGGVWQSSLHIGLSRRDVVYFIVSCVSNNSFKKNAIGWMSKNKVSWGNKGKIPRSRAPNKIQTWEEALDSWNFQENLQIIENKHMVRDKVINDGMKMWMIKYLDTIWDQSRLTDCKALEPLSNFFVFCFIVSKYYCYFQFFAQLCCCTLILIVSFFSFYDICSMWKTEWRCHRSLPLNAKHVSSRKSHKMMEEIKMYNQRGERGRERDL